MPDDPRQPRPGEGESPLASMDTTDGYFDSDITATDSTDDLADLGISTFERPQPAKAQSPAEKAEIVVAEHRAEDIYRSILGRAAEHDFDPKLDRIIEVCSMLGDPQLAYKVIHITGTNGKTSTSRMAESLLRAHGLRTGLFTSPHLTSVRERIVIDGAPIDVREFVRLWDEVSPIIDLVDAKSAASGGPRMSFFEALTVVAFVAFADAPVDVAVVEVGMGGTWDCTNVVQSQVQAIMPISLDHQAWLGDTIAQIADNKAGIIMPGTPVVVSDQPEDAMEVIAARAAELGATVVRADSDFGVVERELAVGGQRVAIRGLGGEYDDVFVPLFGQYQAENAACALIAVELLLGDGIEGTQSNPLDIETVREGFAQATSPGRLEVVRTSPTIIVDAGHNVGGMEATVSALDESFGLTLVGVIGILSDKDAEGILGVLEPAVDRVVITRSSSPRAIDPEDLGAIARDVFGDDRVEVVPSLPDAINRAVELADSLSDDLPAELAAGVLATGSITLAAEVRILLGRG